MKFHLEKGHTAIEGTIDDDKVMGVVTGDTVPAMDLARVRQILSQGVRKTAPKDIALKKTAVIIPDDTRLWARGDVLVPGIIETLVRDLGVPRDRITVIIALGTHRDIDESRFPQLAGSVDGVAIVNSANQDQERLAEAGTTARGTRVTVTRQGVEADHIIIFGGVLHHLIAGFGGGRKYILPGIAGYDAIQQNHSLAFAPNGSPHPLVRPAQLEGNPVHEDMKEAADLFLSGKTSCYAAVAANGQGEIFYADAGELHATFARGCDALDRACRPELPQKGDFAIISAGGHRTDGQLYQATKALFNAVEAVRPGGEILFAAGCNDGVGNAFFGETLETRKGEQEALGTELARTFNMPAYVAFRLMDLLARFRVTLLSDLPWDRVRRLGFETARDIHEAVGTLGGRGYIIPFAENILPRIRQL